MVCFRIPFQFNVKASDKGVPEKTATTLIYISVQRDLKAPEFESLPYRVTVPETTTVGKSVFKLRGRDDDKMVSYSLTSHWMPIIQVVMFVQRLILKPHIWVRSSCVPQLLWNVLIPSDLRRVMIHFQAMPTADNWDVCSSAILLFFDACWSRSLSPLYHTGYPDLRDNRDRSSTVLLRSPFKDRRNLRQE